MPVSSWPPNGRPVVGSISEGSSSSGIFDRHGRRVVELRDDGRRAVVAVADRQERREPVAQQRVRGARRQRDVAKIGVAEAGHGRAAPRARCRERVAGAVGREIDFAVGQAEPLQAAAERIGIADVARRRRRRLRVAGLRLRAARHAGRSCRPSGPARRCPRAGGERHAERGGQGERPRRRRHRDGFARSCGLLPRLALQQL